MIAWVRYIKLERLLQLRNADRPNRRDYPIRIDHPPWVWCSHLECSDESLLQNALRRKFRKTGVYPQYRLTILLVGEHYRNYLLPRHVLHQTLDSFAVSSYLSPHPTRKFVFVFGSSRLHLDHLPVLLLGYYVWGRHVRPAGEDLESINDHRSLLRRQRGLSSYRNLQCSIRLCNPNPTYTICLATENPPTKEDRARIRVLGGSLVGSHQQKPWWWQFHCLWIPQLSTLAVLRSRSYLVMNLYWHLTRLVLVLSPLYARTIRGKLPSWETSHIIWFFLGSGPMLRFPSASLWPASLSRLDSFNFWARSSLGPSRSDPSPEARLCRSRNRQVPIATWKSPSSFSGRSLGRALPEHGMIPPANTRIPKANIARSMKQNQCRQWGDWRVSQFHKLNGSRTIL